MIYLASLSFLSTAIAAVYNTSAGQAFISQAYSDTNFTIYAPSNQAFFNAGFNQSVYQSDPAAVLDILKYHVGSTSFEYLSVLSRQGSTYWRHLHS